MLRVCAVSRGLVSGLELGLARVGLAGVSLAGVGLTGNGLYGSGLSWGFKVASGVVGLVGSGVTFSGLVVTPAVTSSVMSSFTASVDKGIWVTGASSSGKSPGPAGETLVEGSSRSAREDGGPIVTLSVFFSVSSGLAFKVVASGLGVRSSVEAEMVVT